MKEKTTILLAFALSLMLCSCGNTDSNSETITSTTTTTTPVSYTTTSETSTQSETTTTSILTTTTSETDSIIETESSSESTTTVTTTASTATSTKKATTTSIKVTAYDAIMYANCVANVRSGNSTSYDILTTVQKNTQIRVTGICENGWYKVTVDDIEGYMSSTVLSEEMVTTTSTTTTTKKPETTPSTTTTQKTETIVSTYTTDYEYKDAPYYDYDGAYHMVDYINQIRRDEGVGELVADEKLMEAARIRAKELSSYFAHNRPNGDAGISIIWDYYLDLWYMGENIAMNSGYSPYATFREFYNSDGHRKTMLGSDYTLVGIGYYYADDGLLYCCQLFAGEF